MTQDEIIQKTFDFKYSVDRFSFGDGAREAMDEWAKAQSVAFMEWAYNEQWQPFDGYDRWINTDQGNVVLSTPALYESFLLAQLKNNDR